VIHYHAQRFEAANVGGLLIAVICDRCGCGYYYELARVGTGSASSPYWLMNASAAASAAKQARDDLRKRLEHEAELVPCPRCDWINEDLISGYRRGRYRGWGLFAACCGGLGTVASLIAAWYLSVGPQADRGAVPYALIGGPALFVTTAVLVLGLQSWLRRRIRPNRDHPLPPSLPEGSPPALLVDDATGQLEVAAPRHSPDDEGGGWIEFQVGRQELPQFCCECLHPAEPGSSSRQRVLTALDLSIPLCRPCARAWEHRRWLIGLATFGLATGAGIGALAAMDIDEIALWIFSGGLCLLNLYLAADLSSRLTAPFRFKVADAPRGVVRLRFRNDEFRRRLASEVRTDTSTPGA